MARRKLGTYTSIGTGSSLYRHFGVDGSLRKAFGTWRCFHPVPKAIHRHRVVLPSVFLHFYRVVLPPGTKGSSIGYFKRKVPLFPWQVMCRRNGKEGICEARDSEFGSWPPHATLPGINIFWPKMLGYWLEPTPNTKESLKHQFFTQCSRCPYLVSVS